MIKQERVKSKRIILFFSLVIICFSLIFIKDLLSNVFAQEVKSTEGTMSEEKRKALEKGERELMQEDEKMKKSSEEKVKRYIEEQKEWYRKRISENIKRVKEDINKDDRNLEGVIIALRMSGDPQVIPVLLEVLTTHKISNVRQEAAYALGVFRETSVIPQLKTALLNEKNTLVKAMIANALVACGEKEAPFSVLVDIVRRKDIDKWDIDREDAEKIKKDLPSIALEGISGIGTEEAKSIVREALNDRDPSVRLTAARIISSFGEKILALPIIADIARNNNVNYLTRASAIKLLGEMGEISIIKELLNDDNEYIRKEAKEILKEKNK